MKTIRIEGVIGWDFTVKNLENDMTNQEEDYLIVLDSPGGFIIDGFSIFNYLNRFKEEGGKFEVEVDFAGSMTSIIAMAADKVSMRENSSLMFVHRVQGCACGDAQDMFDTGEYMLKLENMLKNIYLNKAGEKLDDETLQDLLESDTWLTAAEAKKHGLADVVIKEKSADKKALLNLGHGVTLDLAALSRATVKLNPLHNDINSVNNLKSAESLLRDAVGFSRRDAKALVSQVSSIVRRDGDPSNQRDVGNQDYSAVIERLNSLFAN